MVMASVWSWVTKMVVTPRSRWMRRDFGADLDTELGVEVGQWLVHQERLRLADDGSAHGDALALAAGERSRLFLEVVGESEHGGGVGDSLLDVRSWGSWRRRRANAMLSYTDMCG